MEEKLNEVKPIIRSILLALDHRASEIEFRNEYRSIEGQDFNCVLHEFGWSFFEFFRKLPDCCRIFNTGREIFIERVSNAKSQHMDHLTILKKQPKMKPGR